MSGQIRFDALIAELTALPVYTAARTGPNGTTFHDLAFRRQDVSQMIDRLRAERPQERPQPFTPEQVESAAEDIWSAWADTDEGTREIQSMLFAYARLLAEREAQP